MPSDCSTLSNASSTRSSETTDPLGGDVLRAAGDVAHVVSGTAKYSSPVASDGSTDLRVRRPPRKTKTSWRSRGTIARIATLGVAIALIAGVFLPGTFVPDTLDLCAQAVTGRFTTWHAPVLAGLWGFLRPSPDVMLVSSVTTFVVASYVILRSRLRPWVSVAVTIGIALAPVTLGWLTTHVKDLWLTVGFLATLAALSILRRSPTRVQRLAALGVAVVMSWMTVASRSVSVVPVVCLWMTISPVGSLLESRDRGPWRLLAYNIGLAGLVAFGCVGSQAALSAVVVRPVDNHVAQATYQFDLAGLSVRAGENLFPAGSLRDGSSLDDIREHFRPEMGDLWLYGEGTPLIHPIKSASIVEAQRQAWIDAIRDHPVDYVQLRTAYTLGLLGFRGEVSGVFDRGSTPESLGIECPVPERRLPGVEAAVADLLDDASSWPMFRGWVFVLLLVGSSLVAGLKRCAESRALLAGGMANLATIVVLGISPTFRYSWFTAVCALVGCGLALGRWPLVRADGASDAVPEDAARAQPDKDEALTI